MGAVHRLRAVASAAMALGLAGCTGANAGMAPTAASLITAPAPTVAAVDATQAGATAVPTQLAPTASPQPTATPGPALQQMSTGGCCTQPFWSPDGSAIWFIDRPPDLPGGIWSIDPAAPLEATFVTDKVGLYSPDGSLVAYPVADSTVIERVDSGETWDVPAYGRAILYSPDGQRLAWQVANGTENFDRRLVEIWVSNLDGSEARRVAQLFGGSLSGWLADSRRLLITQRTPGLPPALGIFDPDANTFTGLATGDFLRGVSLSPDGRWLAYTQQFSGEPERDGIWLQALEGGAPLKVPVFGSYRWRPDGDLVIIPLELNVPAQRVVRFDTETREVVILTDPMATPLQILDGDWSLSPDGNQLVYVNAVDRNIWLLELPGP